MVRGGFRSGDPQEVDSIREQFVQLNMVHRARLSRRLGDDVVDAAVVTSGRYAYRRPDGITVVPMSSLGFDPTVSLSGPVFPWTRRSHGDASWRRVHMPEMADARCLGE